MPLINRSMQLITNRCHCHNRGMQCINRKIQLINRNMQKHAKQCRKPFFLACWLWFHCVVFLCVLLLTWSSWVLVFHHHRVGVSFSVLFDSTIIWCLHVVFLLYVLYLVEIFRFCSQLLSLIICPFASNLLWIDHLFSSVMALINRLMAIHQSTPWIARLMANVG